MLMVVPSVHPLLHVVDVLLRFHLYKVALTADVSKIYRGIMLAQTGTTIVFAWRNDQTRPLVDY